MDKPKLKILITGGTRGLGRTIAENKIRQGHDVYVLSKSSRTDIDPDYLPGLKEYIECDLNNIHELESHLKNALERTGGFDVVINNATVKQFKRIEDFHIDEIRNNVNVDFIAPVIITNLCLPYMKRNNFGRIVNISSISAYKGYISGSLYCSSKRALISFTETLAMELGSLKGAVTVNSICPDSFSKPDGTELGNHKMITSSVVSNIEKIIKSGSNGKIINVFTFKHKIRERLRLIKQSFLI